MAFDIGTYTRRADRLRWDDLDLASFASRPLSPDVLRSLRYMHDVEFHTACYLRDLLVTPAHNDPEVTAFLSVWVYEEFWHGEAIAEVLAAHDEPSGAARVSELRSDLGWRDQVRPVVMNLAGYLKKQHLVALQMAWGMLNESITQTGYQLLARKSGNQVLSELLSRIVRQEGLHLAFYSSQAHARLAENLQTQRFVRRWLARLWRPVGSRLMPDEETAFLYSYLLSDPDGRERSGRIDRRVDSLPGLSGLHLFSRSLEALQDDNSTPTVRFAA